ncbi:MAG: hypothetical protein JWM37_463 [Candidatus Saccharibacteria bacterium]|nr:hypothetical protein [Candidatus Saccharibacteria bacterium]
MNHSTLIDKLQPLINRLYKARYIIFILMVIAVFGYVGWQVRTAISVEPDAATVSAASGKSNSPHIDPATISKIRQLQDNSVEVRALFDQARRNPFQE